MTIALPTAYKGDAYSFTLTFPDASYLAGSPADVLAQIKEDPTSNYADAEFTATVNGAVLTLTLSEVTLDAGTYWTDVQVGSVTYLRKTRFVVEQDVSR